jgi:tRNA(Arg) A34 adenosine deaminase TadA
MKQAGDNRSNSKWFSCMDDSWKRTDYRGIDYNESKYIKSNLKSFVDVAVEAAKKSTMLQRHGCVIMYKNKNIATGTNTIVDTCSFSIHAEVDAINKAKKILTKTELKNSKLIVVRIGQESMNHPLKYSKPCPSCMKCIENIGIKQIFYTTNFERDMCGIC